MRKEGTRNSLPERMFPSSHNLQLSVEPFGQFVYFYAN